MRFELASRRWRAISRTCTALQLFAIMLMLPYAANAKTGDAGVGTSSIASPSRAALGNSHSSAIKRLEYLVGSWAGTKEQDGPDGKLLQSLSRDEIRLLFDGRLLVIEGWDYPPGASTESEPTGRNFAVISGHEDPDKIRITGFTPAGVISGEGTVAADGSTRFTLSSGMQILVFEMNPISPDGWLEKVNISRDAGKAWHNFKIQFSRERRDR